MATLSMNEVTTYRWTFFEDVMRYAEAGYQGIGVWRQKLADFGEPRGIELLAESGLKVTNLLWAGGFTGSDGRSFGEALQDAKHAARLAAEMEAGCLVIYPGGRNNHTRRHADRLLTAALSELLDLASALDVTLAIEPMHPACAHEWTFLSDLDATLEWIQAFDSPLLKMVLDAYHFGSPKLLPRLPELVPYVGVVHLGDRKECHSIDQDRCLLGQGEVQLGEIVRCLLDHGYRGDFDVELIGREIECSDYAEILAGSMHQYDRWVAHVEPR